jgi:hypothetical protein
MSSAESGTQNQQTIAAIRYKPYSEYSTAPSTACNQQIHQPYNDYPSTHSTRQNQQASLTNSSQSCTYDKRIQAHLTAQTAEAQLEDSLDKLSGACSTAFPGEDAVYPVFPGKGPSTSKPAQKSIHVRSETDPPRHFVLRLEAKTWPPFLLDTSVD